jgi:hypothetical protein
MGAGQIPRASLKHKNANHAIIAETVGCANPVGRDVLEVFYALPFERGTFKTPRPLYIM